MRTIENYIPETFCDFCYTNSCTCANCGHTYPSHDYVQDSLACGIVNHVGDEDFTGTADEPCGCECYVCPNFHK